VKIPNLLCSFLLFFQTVDAQTYWVAPEVSYTRDIYRLNDPHGFLSTVALPSVNWGLRVRKMINDKLFWESGASIKSYWDGFRFKDVAIWGTQLSFQALMLNGNAGYRVRLTDKLALVPRAGVGIGVNLSRYVGSGGGFTTINKNGTIYRDNFTENDNVNRVFGLANGSLGLEYTIYKYYVINIHAGYHAGFMKANQLDIKYSIHNTPNYIATLTSTGSYWDVGIGCFWKVHQFWK
jgi:hypothetical protein